MLDLMLSYNLEFIILRQCATLRYVNTNDVQASVVGRTRKTMNALEYAYALHPSMMLTVGMSRFTGNVSLQPCSIPNFYRLVVGRRHEEHVVGRNREPRYSVRVRSQMSN